MKTLLFIILLCFTIDSSKVQSLIKFTEHNCNKTFVDKWSFVAIAEYPVAFKTIMPVPDLSQGKIYCCKDKIGGIVWILNDTACILIKSWSGIKKDTTYHFIWYELNNNKWIYKK
jgi:hypothetical protein